VNPEGENIVPDSVQDWGVGIPESVVKEVERAAERIELEQLQNRHRPEAKASPLSYSWRKPRDNEKEE
jgi:hypothetical protein